jgi:heme-degrading monooxygenase HmoA
MTHLRIWKFRPPDGREQEFADAYSGSGQWAELFKRGRGYRGSTLLAPVEQGGWWLTIDRWDSAGDFDAFVDAFGEDYRALDAELEGVAGEEEFIGAFDEDD